MNFVKTGRKTLAGMMTSAGLRDFWLCLVLCLLFLPLMSGCNLPSNDDGTWAVPEPQPVTADYRLMTGNEVLRMENLSVSSGQIAIVSGSAYFGKVMLLSAYTPRYSTTAYPLLFYGDLSRTEKYQLDGAIEPGGGGAVIPDVNGYDKFWIVLNNGSVYCFGGDLVNQSDSNRDKVIEICDPERPFGNWGLYYGGGYAYHRSPVSIALVVSNDRTELWYYERESKEWRKHPQRFAGGMEARILGTPQMNYLLINGGDQLYIYQSKLALDNWQMVREIRNLSTPSYWGMDVFGDTLLLAYTPTPNILAYLEINGRQNEAVLLQNTQGIGFISSVSVVARADQKGAVVFWVLSRDVGRKDMYNRPVYYSFLTATLVKRDAERLMMYPPERGPSDIAAGVLGSPIQSLLPGLRRNVDRVSQFRPASRYEPTYILIEATPYYRSEIKALYFASIQSDRYYNSIASASLPMLGSDVSRVDFVNAPLYSP